MSQKKRIAFIISALTIVTALAGCTPPAADTPPTAVSPSGTPVQPSPTETPVETSTETPQTPDAQTAQPSSEVHAEGEYVGRIDNNTIEVIVDGTPAAYRLNETTAMQVPALTEGRTIGFTYEQNDAGQDVIIRFDDAPQTLTAVYAGQIDPHSIEVTTDSGPVAFQLTGDALTQVNSLEPGDTIIITFTMNAYGQNVAASLAVQ